MKSPRTWSLKTFFRLPLPSPFHTHHLSVHTSTPPPTTLLCSMFSVWKPVHSSATISHQEFIPEQSLSCVLSVGTGLLKALATRAIHRRRRRQNAPIITQYVDSKKNTWLSGGLTLNHLWSGYWWGRMKCRHPLMHVRSVLLFNVC